MNTETAIVVVMGLLILAVIAWMYVMQRGRSRSLRSHFGTEYERELGEQGSPGRAEAELERRAKRVERLPIRPLPPTERSRFAELWNQEQARFVDDPVAAVTAADQLVEEVMARRGYPMGEFEQRAQDISVEHPHVVENYRAAHHIALQLDHGGAGTEDLRRAMIHYRDLFEELLDPRLAQAR